MIVISGSPDDDLMMFISPLASVLVTPRQHVTDRQLFVEMR